MILAEAQSDFLVWRLVAAKPELKGKGVPRLLTIDRKGVKP